MSDISYFCIPTKTEKNMWQRVQTLYLAISTILVGIMLFSTKAVTVAGDGEVGDKIKFISYIPYLILIIILTLLHILALTTYRFRIFQMRTATLAAILCVALQIWLAVDFFATHNMVIFRLTAIFPFVAVILDMLAARGIMADELLVESAYHLRKSRRERKK